MSRKAAAAPAINTPADKRFRRPESRPVRRRSPFHLRRLWKPAAILAASLVAVAAAVIVLLTAPGLAVDRLVVRGHSRLSASDLESRLAGLRGVNILSVDLASYHARVLESPWVAQASLWRVLPSTIEVRVVERVPAALARVGQQLFLMDATGKLIAEFGPSFPNLDLPIVDGVATAQGRGAPRVDPDRALLVRRFLAALDARPDLGDRVSQLDAGNAHDLVVLLKDTAAYLHVGDERFVERLDAYLEMSPTLGDQFPDIDYVDLRVEGRIAVRARGQLTSAAAPVGRSK